MEKWYAFFIKTGQEAKAAEEIKGAFEAGEVVHLEFSMEKLFRKKGVVHKEKGPMFPGYVFISTYIENDEFRVRTQDCIRRSKSIIKLLRYGRTDQAVMWEDERTALKRLLPNNHCIEASKGLIEGDHVVIIEGPLKGWESMIKSIDRHKMQVVIEIKLLGAIQQAVVGLEIMEKLV